MELGIEKAELAAVDVLLNARAELREIGRQRSKARRVDAAGVARRYVNAGDAIRQTAECKLLLWCSHAADLRNLFRHRREIDAKLAWRQRRRVKRRHCAACAVDVSELRLRLTNQIARQCFFASATLRLKRRFLNEKRLFCRPLHKVTFIAHTAEQQIAVWRELRELVGGLLRLRQFCDRWHRRQCRRVRF